jgi:hypothetical protein
MNAMRFLVLIGILLASSLALTQAVSAADAATLLASLKRELAAIRTSTAAAKVEIKDAVSLDSLRGVSRDTVNSALGPPDRCTPDATRCIDALSWKYSFYRLPPGSRGGGAELHLSFGAKDVVTDAQWKFAQ